MRYSILLTAAVLGLASPAFAQDRTLPAGSYDAAQAPTDWHGTDTGLYGLYQGSSVVEHPLAADVAGQSHRYR